MLALDKNRGGRIIVTSSLLGIFALPSNASYCGAKHGINGYFRALVFELLPLGIKVNILQPGFVKTEISLQALNSKGEINGLMDSDHRHAMSAETLVNRAFKQILKKIST
jgi:dehydrogenase/reductase SDR family protein 7B